MNPEIIQVAFWFLVAAVVIVAYELNQSLKPHYCEQCAHCQALREDDRRRRAEARESMRPYGWRDREDDDRRR